MAKHSIKSVSKELKGSGLIDLMYTHYQMPLTSMAEMADACGGREFRATHIQIAERLGDYHGKTITPELVAELVFDFIRLGIVEVVSASGPIAYRTGIGMSEWSSISEDEPTTYRFGSYDSFVELAEEIQSMQDGNQAPLLPLVVPESSPVRTVQ